MDEHLKPKGYSTVSKQQDPSYSPSSHTMEESMPTTVDKVSQGQEETLVATTTSTPTERAITKPPHVAR
jgi:hypothetical protein